MYKLTILANKKGILQQMGKTQKSIMGYYKTFYVEVFKY